MRRFRWLPLMIVFLIASGLLISAGCAKKENKQQADMEKTAQAANAGAQVELPAAVKEAAKANMPDAEIKSVEVGEEHGITLYDIEFKDDMGEMEVAASGEIIDIATVVPQEDLPPGVVSALMIDDEDINIVRFEKSEVRSEIQFDGQKATIVSVEPYRHVYEAVLEKGGQTGEIAVDAEGNIVEPLKWDFE